MVSTALLLKGQMLYRSEWSKKEHGLALEACTRALKYVGQDQTDIHSEGEITAIIRRLCKDEERRQVTEKWI